MHLCVSCPAHALVIKTTNFPIRCPLIKSARRILQNKQAVQDTAEVCLLKIVQDSAFSMSRLRAIPRISKLGEISHAEGMWEFHAVTRRSLS